MEFIRNNPEAIGAVTRPTIRVRFEPCTCGCAGGDPWHRQTYTRALRSVTIHGVPVKVDSMTLEAARAVAKFPSGTYGVRALVHVWSDGQPSKYVDWTRGERLDTPAEIAAWLNGTKAIAAGKI